MSSHDTGADPSAASVPAASVLYVDDNHADHALVGEVVRMLALPCRVDSIYSGELAISALGAGLAPTDLVVLDVQMPKIDGFQVLDHLRRIWPGVPAVVFSSSITAETRRRALDGGAVAYYCKPTSFEALLELWPRILGHARPRSG
jgi:CheY-like chemotaxis protein